VAALALWLPTVTGARVIHVEHEAHVRVGEQRLVDGRLQLGQAAKHHMLI